MDITAILCEEFNLNISQVTNTINLFQEGATVPFISRYRKEMTGSLSETQVRELQHRYQYYTELEERKITILESIKSQNKLTYELQKKIELTKSKVELEDLYLPYKPKRITRGKKALDAELKPLSEWIVNCSEKNLNPDDEAKKYLTKKAIESGFDTTEKILNGACDIIAEEIADDSENRKWLRELAYEKGSGVTSVKKEYKGKKTKYNMYYEYSESVRNIPSHRVLAMFRGEREKVLRLEITFPEDEARYYLKQRIIKHPDSAAQTLLEKTVDDSLSRLLSTATETEIRKVLRENAEKEAFKVFNENLRTLLLSPPAGHKITMGIDPGYRTGCKVVVVDDTGKLLNFKTIFPTEPKNDIEGASDTVDKLLSKYKVELIAIGNGTASRETEKFMREMINKLAKDRRPDCIIVSEAGASVYSASEAAVKEFPDHDVTVRGAVSIARRLQDPLSELVKIDPKAIGVGQYQHDVNQPKLKKSLEEIVESCVNLVGVDLNLASSELLTYVSGLNSKTAGNIVSYRNDNGVFHAREELKKVIGLGEKTYEQAAGFLRIPKAENPLDNSSVHPERYEFVVSMADNLKTTVNKLIGNTEILRSINKEKFVSDSIGIPTIEDILGELEKPGRDPREKFTYAKFNDSINEIKDLSCGMRLEGTVTNVTNFGAFVDIGVHQDGLVHISEMADKYVKDPTKIVRVGQVVSVTVISVDEELKRISLSMKTQRDQKEGKNKKSPGNEEKTSGLDPNKKKSSQNYKKGKKFVTAKPKFSLKQFMK